MTDFKSESLSFSYIFRIVIEAIHEFPLHWGLRFVLFLLATELLELKALQVDLLEALHAWVVVDGTLESTFRNVGEAREGLHLKVAAVNELIDVLLVVLFKLLFEGTVIFRHLERLLGHF